MGEGVNRCGFDVAKLPVDGPSIDANRYLFLRSGVVIQSVETVVTRLAVTVHTKPIHRIHRREVLCLQGKNTEQGEENGEMFTAH